MRSELWHEVRVAADRLENGTGTDAEFYDAYDAFRKCRADELSAEQRWSWAEQCGRLSAGEPPLPDPTPDEQALAEILWDISGESIGWCDAFKYAQAIIAAGWHR